MSSPRAAALSSMRLLLRTVRTSFAGDAAALRAGRAEVRKQYRAHAGEADAGKAARLVADALDAAAFLRESIVQAKLNDAGRYGAAAARRRRGARGRGPPRRHLTTPFPLPSPRAAPPEMKLHSAEPKNIAVQSADSAVAGASAGADAGACCGGGATK